MKTQAFWGWLERSGEAPYESTAVKQEGNLALVASQAALLDKNGKLRDLVKIGKLLVSQ